MAFRVRIEDTEFGRHEFMVNSKDDILVSPNCDGRFQPIESDEIELEQVIEEIKWNSWDASDLDLEEKQISDFDIDTIYAYIMDKPYRRKEFTDMMKEDGYVFEEV